MKKIKNQPRLMLINLFFISTIAALTSCSKTSNNNTGDLPPAHVMVVNTVEGSAPQYLNLNGVKLNTTAVAYGQSSGYITTTPGNDNAQFISSTSSAVTTSFNFNLSPSAFYTVYYASNGTTNTSYATLDNVMAPLANQATVQFINFSPAVTSAIDVYINIAGASKLINYLPYQTASPYYAVAANSSFTVNASGTATVLLNVPANLQAGSIYTVYITGSSTDNLSYQVVTHNFSE